MAGHGALIRRERQFGVNEFVVEAVFGGVAARAGVEVSREARPIDGAEAHGAGFAAGVELAAGELEIAERVTGSADGGDFGVRGGIVGGRDEIDSGGEDAGVLYNDGAEGTAAAGVHVVDGKLDSLAHPLISHG